MNQMDRFWELVDQRGPDECWEWQGTRDRSGYGNVHGKGRGAAVYKTHRVAYALTYGAIPEGLIVRHRCDNPPCCNPAHLQVGTKADNTRDMDERGRARRYALPTLRGEANPNARLTADDVRAAREARASGETVRSIAARYGISFGRMAAILRGEKWRHVA